MNKRDSTSDDALLTIPYVFQLGVRLQIIHDVI